MTETPAPVPANVPVGDLLRELRNISLKFCQNEVGALSTRIKDALLRESERAKEPAEKASLMQVYRALLGKEAAFEAALLKNLPIELDRAIASDDPPALLEEFAQTRSQLAIVEDADVQREIQILRLIGDLEDLCADTASALTLRICHLRRLETVEVRFNPFRPETFAIALLDAWEDFEGSRDLTQWLLLGFGAADFLPLNALYAGLNQILVARGVMPKERYIVRKKSPAAGSAALWVKSDVMGAQQLEDGARPGPQAFSAARFMQQLNSLSQQLASAADGSPPGAVATGGGTGLAAPQPSPALLAAMDALLAQVQARNHTPTGTLPGPGEVAPADWAGRTSVGLEQIQALREVSALPDPDQPAAVAELNRSTIEMVARIFDFILDDSSIPLQLKILIADLQLPVLKAALTDPAFFLSDQHPARRVVDLLAQLAMYWDLLPSDEVAETARKEVARLREASRLGQDVFADVASSLGVFLAGLEARYEARLQNSLANVTAQEQRAEAMPEVDRSLDQWFAAGPIEEPLALFLRGPWRSVLCEYIIERPQDPAACDAAFANTSLLIWSVLPKINAAERTHLLRQLPVLLGALNAGLDKIRAEPAAREPIMKFLMERHAQVIRPAAVTANPRVTVIPNVEPSKESAPSPSVTRWNAMQLAVGDWFIFEQGKPGAPRYRLSWISPIRT